MDEIREILSQLLASEISSEDDLAEWYRKADEVDELVKLHHLELPHIVWHYLSDADIRYKEPDYGLHQIEGAQAFVRGSSGS